MEVDDAKVYCRQQAGQLVQMQREIKCLSVERDQALQALTTMRKKVQDNVPVISLVEERRLELETQNKKACQDVRGIQEQLRLAMRANAKLRSEITQCEKEREKAELEIQSLKNRLESVRKLNGQKTKKLNDYMAIT